MSKGYIVYEHSRDSIAYLVSDKPDILASHFCSSPGFMYGDLWGNRPERKEANPDLIVEKTPMQFDQFKTQFPELYDSLFYTDEEGLNDRRDEEN